MSMLTPAARAAHPRDRLGVAELLVVLSALVVMLAGFLLSLNVVRLEATREFDRRARLVDSYLQSRLQSLEGLAGDYRRHYAGGALVGPGRVKAVPAHRLRLLPGVAGDAAPAAAATGRPPFAAQYELGAALALEAGARSLLAYNKDVAALRYLSASHFVYQWPAAPVARFRFSDELYRSAAWARAQPAQNPAGEMFASGLHEDAAGPGQRLTLGAPLLQHKRLLGLLSLELRPDVLDALLARQGAAGDLLLVDPEGRVVAHAGVFRPGDTWPQPQPRRGQHRLRDDNGVEWGVAPIAGGRLFLLQRLGTAALLQTAAQRSLPAGLFVVALALVVVLSLRLRQALLALSLHSHRDGLTHALSRRGLYEGAEGLRALATRSHKPLAVVMFDIDAFKKVNELQGHERGDKVLAALVHGLQHQVRDYDVLCRWSGEEFLAVLMLEAPADAIPVAERLRNVAATSCLREALTLVTISAGMAMWQPGESLDAAIARADQSLMAAKAAGRDRLDVSAEVAAAAVN